ncbi:hypothetical protein LOK49_LG05G01785 [Camellia lanceoleosa]|uniref:Uncharacterized protein n=1 Tax=Camellia lanceoleosa TaxID=1840588 RepID=A0ACC0HS72_9ERIC|nr:hypothetical protein LOK49_LG05G01785 [Camellia lanceoleosa]
MLSSAERTLLVQILLVIVLDFLVAGTWGESSSSADVESQGIDDGLKIENGRSSLFDACPGSDATVEERRVGPSNILIRESVSSGIGGNQGTSRPLITRVPVIVWKPPDTEHILTANASSDNVETSYGNSGYLVDNDGGSASSLGSWVHPARERLLKVLLDSLIQVGVQTAFNNLKTLQHGVPACYSASRNAESSSRKYGVRVSLGHHESGRFNLPSTGNAVRHSDLCSTNQSSRPRSFTGSFDLRPTT